MAKRRLLALLLCLSGLAFMAAGGWTEIGGGALLTTTDEWGVERLEVELGFFDFEYRGGLGPAMKIEVYGAADERPLLDRDGVLLTITLADRLRLGAGSRGRIVVYGPAIVDLVLITDEGSISVQTVSARQLVAYSGTGNVTLESIEADVQVHTGAGNVEVIGASGAKRISTDSGDIVVRSSDGNLFVRTISGRVNMWDVSGAIDIDTVFGAVDVVGLTLREQGRITTDSGRIEVVFTQELDELAFDLFSLSGSIQVGEDLWGVHEPVAPVETQQIPFIGRSQTGHQYYR